MGRRRTESRLSAVTRGTSFSYALSCFGGDRGSAARPTRAEYGRGLIAKGDGFDQQLQAEEALEYYLPANKLEPDNVDLLVRIARQYRHMMSDTSSKKRKTSARKYLARVCAACCRPSLRTIPRPSSHRRSATGKCFPTWEARIRSMPRRGSRRRWIARSQLDPNNDTAWHILGRWNRVLADVNVDQAGPGQGALRRSAGDDQRRGGEVSAESNRDQSQPAHPLHRARPHLRRRWDGKRRRASISSRDSRCLTRKRTIRK